MNITKLNFDDLANKTAVVTGGAGLIGATICNALALHRTNVAIVDIAAEKTNRIANQIETETKSRCIGIVADVLDYNSLTDASLTIEKTFGNIDILVNCAGGNKQSATTSESYATAENILKKESYLFHDLEQKGFRDVFDLNVLGTIIPTQVFIRSIIKQGKGAILNVSSMSSIRPLTRVGFYSAAKAAVSNFTKWLAVHYARLNIRVNAIAPGFFLTDQNRFLLIEQNSGLYTPRGNTIIEHTPMGRFGEMQDLVGASLFLVSDLAEFITGVVLPVDGGFSVFSGV